MYKKRCYGEAYKLAQAGLVYSSNSRGLSSHAPRIQNTGPYKTNHRTRITLKRTRRQTVAKVY